MSSISNPKSERAAQISAAGLVTLILLLLVPIAALSKLRLDYRWIAAYAIFINLLTYIIYAHDKNSAREGKWRVSEQALHVFEILGGWPAAFLAQRKLRHKCSKPSFLLVFWIIVLLYQAASADALLHWKFSRAIFGLLHQG